MRRAALPLALVLASMLMPLAAAETRIATGPDVPRFLPDVAEAGVWETVRWSWPAGEFHGVLAVEDDEVWCPLANGSVCTRVFDEPGDYPYRCPVHEGMTGVVRVRTEAGDAAAPLFAYFVDSVQGLTVRFDASPTANSRTAIARFEWDFGDGATGAGRIVEHTYPEPGRYQATLTVVDEAGRSSSYTKAVRAFSPVDPVARFNATANGRSVLFESAPWEGTHAWDFGDGERAVCDPTCDAPPGTLASSATSLLHLYRRGGVFNVTHEVTDANGTRNLTAAVFVDAEETFSLSTDGLRVEADASLLPTYANATFAWVFGDLARAEGARANHSFPGAGVWSVTLWITDDAGVQRLDQDATLTPAAP